jgi:hypothetical protein
VVECGGLEMFAANLDKSSQVSFEHEKPTNRCLSTPVVPYSVRKSVRKIVFPHGRRLTSLKTIWQRCQSFVECIAAVCWHSLLGARSRFDANL